MKKEMNLKCIGVKEGDRRKVLISKWHTDDEFGRPHQLALKIPHAELKDLIYGLMSLWEKRADEENVISLGWCQLKVIRVSEDAK